MKAAVRITYFVLIMSAAVLALWICKQNFPPAGQLEVSAILGEDLPMLSRLGPEVRTKMEADGQAILEGPVYFDLRAMPWRKEATVLIGYREQGAKLKDVAIQSAPGWNYKAVPGETAEASDSNWRMSAYRFDLADGHRSKNVYRFLISIEPLEPGGRVVVNSLKIIEK